MPIDEQYLRDVAQVDQDYQTDRDHWDELLRQDLATITEHGKARAELAEFAAQKLTVAHLAALDRACDAAGIGRWHR